MTQAPLSILDGVRVLSFTQFLLGPSGVQFLADLGADVIKIEPPGGTLWERNWSGTDLYLNGVSVFFMSAHRNQRSLTLDLKHPDGQAVARRLIERADVLVQNFRPGVMARFGLDYVSLAGENPGLVYCSLVAFGEEGEAASRPGYDIIVQALSGLMSFTGQPEGEPTKVGVALLDVICGLYAANGIQAALLGRLETGRGRRITVSLFEASVAGLVNQAANYLLGGIVPARMGNAHPNIVPYQLFDSADRPFILAAGNDRLFARTCEVIGRPELAEDARFATNEARVRNRAELVPLLAEIFRTRSSEQWLGALEAAAVPCAPVRAVDEVFASPEGAAMIQEVADPVRGMLRLVADPIRLSGALPPVRTPPPRLGQHTAEVLRELEIGPER